MGVMKKEEGLETIKKLVSDFYKQDVSKMNETETRQKYIDVFFECLGWNIRGHEVKVEESESEAHENQRVRKGRVDYRFSIDCTEIVFT